MQKSVKNEPQKGNPFYRKTYPLLLNLLALLVITSLVLICGIYYKMTHPKKTQYFMVLKGNKNAPLIVLSAPLISKQEIIRWASQSVIAIYNFDFGNWESKLEETSSLFTKDGFASFKGALESRGTLKTIEEEKLQVTAVLQKPPFIAAEGVIGGRYTWKVVLPVLLTYDGGGTTRQRAFPVTMLISRVPVTDSKRGYAIEQFYEG